MGLFDVLGFKGDLGNYHKYSSIYDSGRQTMLRQLAGLDTAYSQSEGLLKGLMPIVNKGFAAQRAQVGRSGQAAKLDVGQNQQKALGMVNTGLSQQGLGSTTILQNAQRGVTSDTSREMARIDEDVGSMLANIQGAQTQAQLGAQGALASFYPQKALASMDARQNYVNFLLNNFASKPNFGNYLGSTLNSGSQLAAFGLGGGF